MRKTTESTEEGQALIGLHVILNSGPPLKGKITEVKLVAETTLKIWSGLGHFAYLIENFSTRDATIKIKDQWWFRGEFEILSPLEQLAEVAK